MQIWNPSPPFFFAYCSVSRQGVHHDMEKAVAQSGNRKPLVGQHQAPRKKRCSSLVWPVQAASRWEPVLEAWSVLWLGTLVP